MEWVLIGRPLSPSPLWDISPSLGLLLLLRDARWSPEQEDAKARQQQPCLKVGALMPFVIVWSLGDFLGHSNICSVTIL